MWHMRGEIITPTLVQDVSSPTADVADLSLPRQSRSVDIAADAWQCETALPDRQWIEETITINWYTTDASGLVRLDPGSMPRTQITYTPRAQATQTGEDQPAQQPSRGRPTKYGPTKLSELTSQRIGPQRFGDRLFGPKGAETFIPKPENPWCPWTCERPRVETRRATSPARDTSNVAKPPEHNV